MQVRLHGTVHEDAGQQPSGELLNISRLLLCHHVHRATARACRVEGCVPRQWLDGSDSDVSHVRYSVLELVRRMMSVFTVICRSARERRDFLRSTARWWLPTRGAFPPSLLVRAACGVALFPRPADPPPPPPGGRVPKDKLRRGAHLCCAISLSSAVQAVSASVLSDLTSKLDDVSDGNTSTASNLGNSGLQGCLCRAYSLVPMCTMLSKRMRTSSASRPSTRSGAAPSRVPESRSANLGQDFEEQHRRPSIGLATFQMWPDNYNTSDPNFASVWIGNHTIAARAIGKPLILDEVSKPLFAASSRAVVLSGS